MYNFSNFHDATFGIWTRCAKPRRKPDFVSGSGSAYWDIGDHVIRSSNHWMHTIRSCSWVLKAGKQVVGDKVVTAKIAYSDLQEAWCSDDVASRRAYGDMCMRVFSANDRKQAKLPENIVAQESLLRLGVVIAKSKWCKVTPGLIKVSVESFNRGFYNLGAKAHARIAKFIKNNPRVKRVVALKYV